MSSPIYYSVSIVVEDPGPLDGVSPLPPTAVIDRTRTELVQVRIPAGSNFGLFDPGQIVARQSKDFMILTATVISEGAPLHAPGSKLSIVSPPVGVAAPRELEVQPLGGLAGIFPQLGQVIPLDHNLALDTIADGAAGPHRIDMTLVSLDGMTAGEIVALLRATSGSVVTSEALVFSPNLQNVAGTASPEVGVIQRYDATGLNNGDIVIQAPSSPQDNQLFGVKEWGSSAVSITVDGNGNDIEGLSAPPAASFALADPGVHLLYKFYDGAWRTI